jgi:predicted ATPase
VDRVKTLSALLIVTFRPEFDAPWAGRSHVTSLALNRLGERGTAAIIACLVGNKELPADVMAEIVERTRHSAVCGGNDQGGAGSGE